MRDPNRLDAFYARMAEIHKEELPDLRFGQMCSVFFGWLLRNKEIDFFFPEEDKMLEYFEEFVKAIKRK